MSCVFLNKTQKYEGFFKENTFNAVYYFQKFWIVV